MISARDTVLASIRRSLAVSGEEAIRRDAVRDRLGKAPRGIVPARGQLPKSERIALFVKMLESVSGTVEHLASPTAVPAALATYLRAHNLPQRVRRGADARLAALPWETEPTLEILEGRAAPDDLVGLSHASAGIGETGTLVLLSGPDNPTTLNFLPDTHIVVLSGKDVVGDMESAWDMLRARHGKGQMPRAVNTITGPSRSADIEQTLLLGAHGPRRLHVLLVD